MDRLIAAWRLRNQRLTAPHEGSAADVVRRLTCVQAENPSQSAWAVATRTQHPDASDLAGLLESGKVLRTHVLRSTWHYASRDDLDWLLALTGPRLQQLTGRQLREEAELEPAAVERLGALVLELLADRPDRTRGEITEALRERSADLGEGLTGRTVMTLMAHLEMGRLVCSGRPRDGEHTYASWADRVPSRVALHDFDREEALARIARRYLTGHGPATVKDLAYWATLTATEARRGVEANGDRLASFDHDGRTFWHLAEDVPPTADESPQPRGHLLQLLDETYRGYQDSRWVLDADGVVPRGRETAIGIALVDGQLVAGMKRTVARGTVRFDLTPHRPLTADDRAVIDEAAQRYGAFLDLEPQVLADP